MNNPSIIYKRAETNEELQQILELQRTNIPASISEEEKKKEGFVTVHHTFEILKAMNDKCTHVIAKYNDEVVGYALCMLKEFKEDIEVLKPMFQKIDARLQNSRVVGPRWLEEVRKERYLNASEDLFDLLWAAGK